MCTNDLWSPLVSERVFKYVSWRLEVDEHKMVKKDFSLYFIFFGSFEFL